MFNKSKSAVLDNPKYEESVIEVDYSREVRCPGCGRLICYGEVRAEIKCPKCKKKFKSETR
jgi:ribosomal protein S27E